MGKADALPFYFASIVARHSEPFFSELALAASYWV